MKNLEPGRELDALVAEKVMGYGSKTNCRRTGQRWVCQCGTCDPIEAYSTDIAAAFMVVEKIPYHLKLTEYNPDDGPQWTARFQNNGVPAQAEADTIPLAICLAALKAKGYL